ncbi:MAG: hypothetical protein HRU20_18705 [Pseudomonadales bacterium]|nr:hypothetical protein [Pseudomonadales bacterium]
MQELVALMQLQSFLHRDYMSLSAGERQRVQLARVLAQLQQPESQALGARFLLLDE